MRWSTHHGLRTQGLPDHPLFAAGLLIVLAVLVGGTARPQGETVACVQLQKGSQVQRDGDDVYSGLGSHVSPAGRGREGPTAWKPETWGAPNLYP